MCIPLLTRSHSHTLIAALLCMIGSLRSFGQEKLQYWRERASGMSSLAYFLARDTMDHFNTVVKPLVFLSMFYFFNNPRSSIFDNYLVLLALVYCVTGFGYTFSICFQPGTAQLVCDFAATSKFDLNRHLSIVLLTRLHFDFAVVCAFSCRSNSCSNSTKRS